LLLNADLHVTYLNPAAETLLELSRSRILGEKFVQQVQGDQHTEVSLRSALETQIGFTKRQTTLTLVTEQSITVDFSVTPVVLGEQALIIEIQPLDRLMRISREEAIISSQQMTRTMVRGLAHEIKNPLGGLRGAAQLLARELHSPELLDFTNVIIEEADRLRDLVDRMLSAPSRLLRETVNIHEVLERVLQLITADESYRSVIHRDYDPSIPEFTGDRAQLIQAVLNIARNAVQAMSEDPASLDTATLQIKTRTQRQFTIGNQRHRLVCQIDITDNGPGIPEELRDTIFFPMISGRADGTGLGLAIAQSIINQHSGLIEYASNPGKTVFSILIPLEDSHE